MDADVSELATVGAEIAEIGEKLKGLRTQRDTLQKEISELESKLTPLVVKHSKIIAGIVGTPVNVRGNGYSGPNAPPGTPPPEPNTAIKQRILRFLDQSEPGTSAMDVANALKLDATVVRDIMRDLARGG